MTDEQKPEQSDDDAIEGTGLGGSLHIPVNRSDVGPYIKWIIFAISAAIVILAVGGLLALSK